MDLLPAPNYSLYSSWESTEENWFSFANVCYLEIASWIGMVGCEDLVHTITLSVSSFVRLFYCVWNTLLHWYLIHLTHLNPERRNMMKTSHLGRSVAKSLNICTYPVVGLYIYCYLFYQETQAKHWSVDIEESH